ncbi:MULTISPECIES: hypothetical protein [Alteromonadaceae]|uniref:hypothetical protein n=1 Tax=Alteromonadaceae TaxID=72275 RepID=UPI001C08544C|nr:MULTISPECIES: hypothetical protein [Aliiglaciecola]MBU2878857.1 hypothetical protein [Aliiglaciecola lipolytica]MDO6711244.1 hypothetical protein [Aliiglaciecola sp. 2_MG-2023]MDO6752307.1 hypothetical protein [Aliiglaciecola sp. 1_MG-2023]
MTPMDQAYIERRDIANRYMQGKLCAEECEEFEIYLMENPDVVDQLQLDSMFIKALPFLAQSPKQKPTFWQLLFATPARASIGTLCAGALLFSLVVNFEHLVTSNSTFSSPSMVYVSSARGNTSNVDQTFSLNDVSSSVSLVLQDEFDVTKTYQINMFINSSSSPIYTASYTPNTEGEVVISVDKEMLQVGLIEIQYSLDESNNRNKKSLVVAVRD